LAEDEDIEQNSEEYRKWRTGNDNDKYASSKTPTESGSKSGSYAIPKADDEYALPGEEENNTGGGFLDGEVNWVMIGAAIIIFAIIASAISASVLSSGESDAIEWTETEGFIDEQRNSKTFIVEEKCKDENDDGWEDDWECWKEFVYEIDLTTSYLVDNQSYQIVENYYDIEIWYVDELKQDGGEAEEELFNEFTNYWDEQAVNGTISINSTINVVYDPANPAEGYAFTERPGDPLGFLGYFFMCCMGFICAPVIIIGIIITWAKNTATDIGRGGRGRGGFGSRGFGRFGGFGRNNSPTRRHTPVRRSGGGGRRR
jgi:hypothetical protein